jgi:hypothetical protein
MLEIASVEKRIGRQRIPIVIRGLDPRIHQSSQTISSKRMGCRVKPGNDKA